MDKTRLFVAIVTIICAILLMTSIAIWYVSRADLWIGDKIGIEDEIEVLKTEEKDNLPATEEKVESNKNPFRYEHKTPDFSSVFPVGFNVRSFAEGSGEIIFIESSDLKSIIQIFIRPYSESSEIDVDSIKKVIPDIVIENPLPIQIGDKQIGVVFVSNNSGFSVREVWFVKDGFLYQITASVSLTLELENLLDSWE